MPATPAARADTPSPYLCVRDSRGNGRARELAPRARTLPVPSHRILDVVPVGPRRAWLLETRRVSRAAGYDIRIVPIGLAAGVVCGDSIALENLRPIDRSLGDADMEVVNNMAYVVRDGVTTVTRVPLPRAGTPALPRSCAGNGAPARVHAGS